MLRAPKSPTEMATLLSFNRWECWAQVSESAAAVRLLRGFFLQCKQIGPNNESMSLHVPSRGGNAVWAHRWRTHQGQMLIQEGANGTVTAHHIKLHICRRTTSALHTACLLFIYLSGRLCWSVWCYVMCGCGRMLHQLDPSPHTPAGLRQIPPMCYSSHNPSNFTMNSVFIFSEESTSAACACGSRFHWSVVVTRAFHVLWYSMTLSMIILLGSDWYSFINLLQLTKLVRKAAAQHVTYYMRFMFIQQMVNAKKFMPTL